MCQMTMIDHVFIGFFCFFGVVSFVFICIDSHLAQRAPIRLDPQTQALMRIAMKYREKQAEAEAEEDDHA